MDGSNQKHRINVIEWKAEEEDIFRFSRRLIETPAAAGSRHLGEMKTTIIDEK